MVKRLVTFFSTVAMGTPRFFRAKNEVQIIPTKMRLTGIHTRAILSDLHDIRLSNGMYSCIPQHQPSVWDQLQRRPSFLALPNDLVMLTCTSFAVTMRRGNSNGHLKLLTDTV